MLNWVRNVLGGLWSGVSAQITSLVQSVVGGLAGVLDTLFGDVTGAWDDVLAAARDLEQGAFLIGKAIWHRLDEIFTYWIPRYVYVAWWWVTHPLQFTDVLLWYVLHWAEQRAWTVGRYLGDFMLAMITHQLRRFLAVLETVVAAVL